MNLLRSTLRATALILFVTGALSVKAPALWAAPSNFNIGTATATALPNCSGDPGGVSGNCWGLNVSCPNVKPIQPYDATVKVTSPAGSSQGTVIFITGGGGVQYYDTFIYGGDLILAVVGAGFTAAQVVFDNPVAGWLTGPAADGNGPISLACLPATAMQWVHDAVLTVGTPLCATGNSGGSIAIAYALSQYGRDSIFAMAEPTSGPEFSRIDYGCAPSPRYITCALCGFGTQSDSFQLSDAEDFVDPAYTGVVTGQPNGPCSAGIEGSRQNAALFRHDSILSDTFPPQLSFATQIHSAFGGQDTDGGAIPEGIEWASYVSSAATIVCVPSAGHEMPNYPAGEAQIQNDLIKYCKLPQ
jgi:hypothetical protein